ncbi:MAG TPA: acyl-CoA dehydrogenase family protein [Jatrophihabitans sp.]|jgi:alkylation response protein AidB-like acyl-CoA dehydrogenase|uniref:acyl-CoA dehydrogenase family protein n=1 Tax=Jatrophihabitans sp. TaxID=1932789 RepID=UPI002EDE5F29
MEIDLSAAQLAVRQRFGQLFDAELAPSIRRMGEQPRTGDPAEVQALRQMLWSALTDLGATRLLLPERHGGEAAGQQGAVVLAELLGGALCQGPLLDTMTAAEALAGTETLAGNEGNGKLLGRIAEGAPVVLAFRERGAAAPLAPLTLGDDRVSARRRFVSFAQDAECLCVIGSQDGRPVCVLSAADHPTVSMRRQLDTGRGELYDVALEGTPVLATLAGFADAWPWLLANARLRHAAYLVGMCQAALELAVERANTRRQFGQLIGRFQAPSFAMAAATTRVEAARWLIRATAWEADQGADVRLGAAQALAMAADLSRTVISTAMQAHGAYGTTEGADIQLYFRRAAVERAWWGSPRALRAEVLPLLLADRRAARPGAQAWC